MAEAYLKEPSLDGLPPDRLKKVEEKYHQFKADVVSEEKELSVKQTEKLKDFIHQLTQIKNKIAVIRQQCVKQNANLGKEISAREKKLEGFKTGAKNFQLEEGARIKIAEEEKKFLTNCQKRIQVANSINYEKLYEIEIDEKKSIANEVFKWIIVSIYGEPENKYYWPNFRSQVLEKKDARDDLKERLGKVSPYNAKEEQRVHTSRFIEIFKKVKASPEFNKCEVEIDRIYEIAQIFLECCQIAKHLKNYQAGVENSRKQNTKEDEYLEQMRRECDALVEKYNLGELYLKQLTSMDNSLSNKLTKYQEEVKQAETYTSEMENMTVSRMMVSLEPEKRQNCQCRIY